MTAITIYDRSTGLIMSNADVPDELLHGSFQLALQHDYVFGTYGREGYWVNNGAIVELPPKPHLFAYLNPTTKQWVDPRTLETVQAAAWGAMKALRSQKEAAGFTWDGSVFDSDQVSQSRIMGAVQLAVMSPGFEIPWTLQDNTVRTLSASDMMAVGAALGGHVAAIFARAQELRVEIYAATSIAAVDAITWDAP